MPQSTFRQRRHGVWTSGGRGPPAEEIERSLAVHDEYYAMLRQVLEGLQQRHGRFVVLDIHSYNHRRDGPGSAASEPSGAPEINIGTFSMDRKRWAHVVEPFMETLRAFEFRGRTSTCARTSPSKEGENKRASFMKPSRRPAARSRWSSRSSSWTNGRDCPTGKPWSRCVRCFARRYQCWREASGRKNDKDQNRNPQMKRSGGPKATVDDVISAIDAGKPIRQDFDDWRPPSH